MHGLPERQFLGAALKNGEQLRRQLFRTVLRGAEVNVFACAAGQPLADKGVVKDKRFFVKLVLFNAQQNLQAGAEVRQLVFAPVHHAAQRLGGQRRGCAQDAADSGPPEGPKVAVAEKPTEPAGKHCIQAVRVFLGGAQRAAAAQQVGQHLCIQENALTAGRHPLQRVVPMRVVPELRFQLKPIIVPDVLQIIFAFAANLDAVRPFCVNRNCRNIPRHKQNAQPVRKAVRVFIQRFGQRVFLRAAALVQAVQQNDHPLVMAVDGQAERLADELLKQLFFAQALHRGAVLGQM